MRRIVVGIMVVTLLCSIAVGRAPAQEAPKQDQTAVLIGGGAADFDPNQPIKPGFTLSLNVTSAGGTPEPDLTGVFSVDPVGNIQMKLAGAIPLRGLTPSQAADKVAALLKPYIKDPKVTLNIVAVPKPVLFLSGGINRPGAIPVNDDVRLAEVLTVIGFTDNADLSKVRVVHRDEKGNRTIKEYDFLRWLKPVPGAQPDEAQNPALADRDLIYVPLKVLPGTGNVSVEGQVARPGVVPIRVGVPTTVREALSLAGGVAPLADRRNVSIRRIGVERPLLVDYDKAEAGDPVHNLTLSPDDIVYVQSLAQEQFITVNGAFARPGRLPYNKDITLTQAISDAGGLIPTAKAREGRIFRHVNSQDPTRTQIIAFNYEKLRRNKESDQRLEPGDTIEILIGEAPRPAPDAITLAQQLLSIALIVDRLFTGRRGSSGF